MLQALLANKVNQTMHLMHGVMSLSLSIWDLNKLPTLLHCMGKNGFHTGRLGGHQFKQG